MLTLFCLWRTADRHVHWCASTVGHNVWEVYAIPPSSTSNGQTPQLTSRSYLGSDKNENPLQLSTGKHTNCLCKNAQTRRYVCWESNPGSLLSFLSFSGMSEFILHCHICQLLQTNWEICRSKLRHPIKSLYHREWASHPAENCHLLVNIQACIQRWQKKADR